jgi:hypothetical protein
MSLLTVLLAIKRSGYTVNQIARLKSWRKLDRTKLEMHQAKYASFQFIICNMLRYCSYIS